MRDMKMEEIRKIYDKVFGTRPKARMIKSILIDENLKSRLEHYMWISKTGFHSLYMQFMPVRLLQQIVNGKTEKQKYVIVRGHNYVFVCLLGQTYFLMFLKYFFTVFTRGSFQWKLSWIKFKWEYCQNKFRYSMLCTEGNQSIYIQPLKLDFFYVGNKIADASYYLSYLHRQSGASDFQKQNSRLFQFFPLIFGRFFKVLCSIFKVLSQIHKRDF